MPNDEIGPEDLAPLRVGGRGRARGRAPGVNDAATALPFSMSGRLDVLLASRQHRLRQLALRLGVFVLLPTFIAWFYTALIATPRYVCNFEITYQAYQPDPSLAGGLTQSILGTSETDSVDYGTLIYEYIRSAALAEQVDEKLHLRQQYASGNIDWFSRLPADASNAKFLSYWRRHVAVSEGFGGYLTINVQGFDAGSTLTLAQVVDADADAMIDGLNARARQDEIKSATVHLDIAAAALKTADDALTAFRNAHGDLDPDFAATQLATIVGTLESQLAILQAQLAQAQANLQPGSSQIVQLNLQVGALKKQIAFERQRLSDNSGSATYSNTVASYQDLLASEQFASNTYQAAQQGLVVALADAASKQNFVVDFVPPILPDHPTMPDPLMSSFTVFLACFSAYGILNLLFAALRDQAGL